MRASATGISEIAREAGFCSAFIRTCTEAALGQTGGTIKKRH